MTEADAVPHEEELRMLRAKAYGPGGVLTSAELARLQQLEGRSVAPEAQSPHPHQPPQTQRPHQAPNLHQTPDPWIPRDSASEQGQSQHPDDPLAMFGDPGSATDTATDTDEASHARTRRRRAILGVSVVAAVIGVGIGWGLWGWDGEAAALAIAHSEQREQLEEKGTFDPGSVTPLADQYGVVVWRADRHDGEEVCVLITADDAQMQSGCAPKASVVDGGSTGMASASMIVPAGEEKAGQQLSALLLALPSGQLVPYLQVWGMETSWESQFTDEEREQLSIFEAAGYSPESLSVIGYDGEVAVWSSWSTGQLCLLAQAEPGNVDAGIHEACAENESDTISLGAMVDGVSTRYVVTRHDMYGPQFTIYKDVDTSYYFE